MGSHDDGSPRVPVLDEAGLVERMEGETPLVVLYYADWCGYCIGFLPLFEDRAARAAVDFVAVDLSATDAPLWDAHDIDVVPSVVAYRAGGEVAAARGRLGVGVTAAELDRVLDEAAR